MQNYVDNPFKSPAVLSYCTGLRGLERGLDRACGKSRVLTYVEIEAVLIANLVAGMETGLLDSCPVWTDAKTFPSKSFYNKVHGIIGGYPCQPFSVAGLRNGTEHPGHLWPYFERDIKAIRPVFCFFENVPGHLSLGFNSVHASLRNMGYDVEAGIYSAEQVGATHERERLFILAVANASSYRRYKNCEGNEPRQFNPDGKTGGDKCQMGDSNSQYGPVSEWEQRQKGGKSIKNVDAFGTSKEMANSYDTGGKEQWGRFSIRKKLITSGRFSKNRFPAPPGFIQYEWEQPRTVKSSLGSTINGYNFRGDLVHAFGNGVVEQTAELAFIDLMIKHGLDHLLPNFQ